MESVLKFSTRETVIQNVVKFCGGQTLNIEISLNGKKV